MLLSESHLARKTLASVEIAKAKKKASPAQPFRKDLRKNVPA